MNNFYNRKDRNTADDFEKDTEDFLNSSMKDMNSRNQSTKKNNNSQKNRNHFSSFDSDILFNPKSKTPEYKEYMSTIFRGFIFIFMLLISLFSIFLIFKTPYYNYYAHNDPIILDKNNDVIFNDSFAKTTEKLKEEILEPKNSKVKLPTAVASKPAKIVADEDEMLRREFENAKPLKNQKDTEITTLLKKSETILEKDYAVNNKNKDSLPKDLPANDSFKYPNVDNKTKTTQLIDSSITDKNSSNKANKISEQRVWLVNIYSTIKKDDMPERMLRLKNQHKAALAGTTFYFVENQTDIGVTHRISVTKNQSGISYPSFANFVEAKSFCDSLKSQGLDCFVSAVNKSLLPKYIIK